MTLLYKSKPYIFAFLLFIVASSKHIIIYNEELLVAGTFVAFVIYIWTAFGNSIKDSIDESRNSILQELQSLAIHKKNGALHLKKIHEKVPAINKSLSSIQRYVFALVSQVGDIATKSYTPTARYQLQYRCEQARTSSQLLYSSYQQSLSDSFLPGILVSTTKKSGLKAKNGDRFADTKAKAMGGSIKIAQKGIALLQKKTT